MVDGVDAAIAHIERYGSHHTDCIVTEDEAAAEKISRARSIRRSCCTTPRRNSPTAANSASAREIGIATGRMHARGPVGVEQLTTFKYRIRGSGQTRP